jgi:hypothetical protein
MISSASFVASIQSKLPCAKLFWQKKPGPLVDWQACALTATNTRDPSKTFTMTFDDGLGEEPLDDIVRSFVDKALCVFSGNKKE